MGGGMDMFGGGKLHPIESWGRRCFNCGGDVLGGGRRGIFWCLPSSMSFRMEQE